MMPDPNSTQLRPPSRAKSLACPICGDVPVKSYDLDDDEGMAGLVRTDCVDASAHFWSVRWVAAA